MKISSLAAAATVALALSCSDRGTGPETGVADSLSRAGTRSPVSARLAVGINHTCAFARRGLQCWGDNGTGQLNVPPVQEPTQVSAGDKHTCALDANGVKCWGGNTSMQLNVPVLRHPRQVSAGAGHTCALDDDGVKCWGNNQSGQLTVPALQNPTQVSAATSHTCALDANGVKCWGANSSGQTSVPPLNRPTQVSAAMTHTCALDADGVKCWGRNAFITAVPPLRNPTHIASGSNHVCAIAADGITCWGNNSSGQTTVPPLRRPTEIGAGRNHSCAIDDDDEVKCWGSGPASTPPADLRLVGRHVCMASNEGLRCAGDNDHGQLGAGHDRDRVVALAAAAPTALGSAFDAPLQVAVGGGFGCTLSRGGAVKCWGYNGRGQLGLGDTRARGIGLGEMGDALPELAFGSPDPITKIDVGDSHACALDGPGEVFCWGNGSSGQLGTEATSDVGTVSGPTRPRLKARLAVRDLALGRAHTCVLGTDGAVYCFGSNDVGQLGRGRSGTIGDRPGTMGEAMQPVMLGDDFRVKGIASGDRHACALSEDGRIKCWGWAASGQLGLGDTRDRGASADDMGAALPAVDLGHGQFATDIDCGRRHCCAKTIQNTIKCWGDNSDGQLGLGDLVARGQDAASMGDKLPFVMTPPLERVLSIRLDGDRTCARTDSGLRCWGRNRSGELGYGDQLTRGGSLTTVPRLLAPLGI